jgi:hypothetical protein
MDFLFYVPFFCIAAAGEVTEILNVCFVNIEFRERQKADFEPSLKNFSFRQNNSGLSPSSAQTARINST